MQAESRIQQPVDDSKRVTIRGNVNPRIRSAVDQGPVDPSMVLPDLTLALRPSASQQADLDRLLAQQQDPSSANYHQWLTPEQFGSRFGASQADIDKLVSWLGQHGLSVKSTARGRMSISFSGTAAQINSAFGVQIHHYLVNGKVHYANASNPTIPAAFQGIVTAVQGMHDFRLQPRVKPRATVAGQHVLAPADIATIYDLNPLYSAGINGTGVKIAIAGQTEIELSDIQNYRTHFSLPTNVPTTLLVPGDTNPGISEGDLAEADLDIEITGAVAPNASIEFVYTANEDDAFEYIIDQNLAPILSTSYGACELEIGTAASVFEQTLVLQANAQGMSIFAPGGDNGALDCADSNEGADEDSQVVDYPGSMPQITSVGGLEFNEGSGTYWSASGAALSYIPEMVWNDSAQDNTPSAGGGGASFLFDKPWWQTGNGVPADYARDTPDVSLAASADHDGFLIYTGGTSEVVGGTSAATPQFASMVALIGEYEVSKGYQSSMALGQINPVLYALASVSGVYHDITVGTNAVPPCDVQENCALPATGYAAGSGYDQASGLGSIDANNFAQAWHAATLGLIQSAETLGISADSIAFSGTTVLTATITASGAAPTGNVRFATGNSLLGTAAVGANGTATLTISGGLLAPGPNTISAQYLGDSAHSGAAAFGIVTVTTADNDSPVIGGVSNGASFTQSFAPGDIISIFGTELAPTTAESSAPLSALLGGTQVTIDGLEAPLYYASPGQLNVQIPYNIPAGSQVTLTVFDGENVPVSVQLVVSAVAPAIFTYSGGAPIPFTTAAQGQEVYMFITGAGAVSPAVLTGQTPPANATVSELPAPVDAVTVTVGGASATVDFVGEPTWSVGVIQVNYTIPTGVTPGAQPVVVSINGVESAAATLTITQ
jgi:uncharacterized protein (TIGR03437 family)